MSAVVGEAVDYILDRDWVSFVELRDFLARAGVPVAGDHEMHIADTNIVLWAGMSPEYVEVVESLRSSGRVILDAGSPLAYLVDGGALRLPIAKRPPKAGYREPHWAPVFFRPRKEATK